MKIQSALSRLITCSFLAFFAFACLESVPAQKRASKKSSQQPVFWKTFAPAGKNFQVSLPAEPEKLDEYETEQALKLMIKQVNTSDEKAPFMNHFTIYRLDTRWARFAIVVLDYKWQNIEYDKDEATITLSSEKMIDDVNTHEWLRIMKAKPVSANEYRSDYIDELDANFIKSKSFITKDKVYLLGISTPVYRVAPKDLFQLYQGDVDRFFNSFQIVDNKTQIARNKGTNR